MRRAFIENDLSRNARLAAAGADIPQWKIAEKLGISPAKLCGWRRHGMTVEEYVKVINAIEEIKKGEADGKGQV